VYRLRGKCRTVYYWWRPGPRRESISGHRLELSEMVVSCGIQTVNRIGCRGDRLTCVQARAIRYNPLSSRPTQTNSVVTYDIAPQRQRGRHWEHNTTSASEDVFKARSTTKSSGASLSVGSLAAFMRYLRTACIGDQRVNSQAFLQPKQLR